MSAGGPEPTEQELREAYEQEVKRLRVEHVVLDGVVTLVNLGMRRSGLVPGTEAERDPEQVRIAIEAVRAHMPLVEALAPEQANSVRQALSQLQLAYVRIAPPGASVPGETGGEGPVPPAGDAGAPGTPEPEPAATKPPVIKPGEAGPAQRSGRLWVPGT
jgi:hypothetical protein